MRVTIGQIADRADMIFLIVMVQTISQIASS